MKTKKYKGNFFDDFFKTFDKAQHQAVIESCIMEYEFNGILCRVSDNTSKDFLWRDYSNAHMMKWKTIGPDCVEKYDDKLEAFIKGVKAVREAEAAEQEKEYREKERKEREVFAAKVEGIELELSDVDGWKKSREANMDGYGGAALDYAEGWAKLMQVEIAKGKTIAECADYTQNGLGFFGITGFQYGCAVSTLSQVWKHGAELRKWHNKKYGVESETGTVNPAILTINT